MGTQGLHVYLQEDHIETREVRIPMAAQPAGPQNRTEQLRKLGQLKSYNLDQFNQKESSYAASKKVQNSAAVETVERGLSPSRFCIPWELFSSPRWSWAYALKYCMYKNLPIFYVVPGWCCFVAHLHSRVVYKPPRLPRWQEASTLVVPHLLWSACQSCIQAGTCPPLPDLLNLAPADDWFPLAADLCGPR